MAQSLHGAVPLMFASKEAESAVLSHADLSLYNILFHENKKLVGIIDSEVYELLSLWAATRSPYL
jgi:Ser/Thr protein kinase RdoA (MazF antagonist)